MTTNNDDSRAALREVARAFMLGFWDDPESGPLARAALRQAWEMRKRSPDYEALRERLSEAMTTFLHDTKQP